jgi:hypothetical protein
MADQNPFDQFDTPAAASTAANPFDQFDGHPVTVSVPKTGVGSQATQGDALYGTGSTAPRSADESLFQKVNDFGNDLGDATLHNLGNLPVGVAQLAAHGVGALANAGASTAAPDSLGAKIAGYVGDKVNALDNSIANREATYQAAVPTNTASVIGATVGNVLPFLAGGEVTAAPKAATLLGKIGIGAATGGGIAATQPVTSGAQQGQMAQQITGDQAPSFATQKAEQIGLGAVTGGALPAIGAIPGKLIGSVSPEVQALAQKAQSYGIDLNAPQISKSIPLKLANSTTAPIPFSGATAALEKQQGQFNNAVAQTIGLPQGTTKITPDVFNQAKQVIGQGYDDLAARNNLTINPPLVGRIQQILGEVHTDADPDAASALSRITQEIFGKASQNGSTLTGQQFQSIDSRLGRLAANPQGGDKAHYAGQLQDALREGMESGMSPADAAKASDLRSQWRNVLNLTPILTSGDGNVPPTRLLAAVSNNKIGKTQLATGNRGDLGTLAQIGKQFLTDPIPNSGTALRNVGMDTLKGLGAVGAGSVAGMGAAATLPAVAGTVGAARLIQSGLRSRALYNALAKLPQDQQTPIRNALAYLLETQAGQGVNKLNAGQNP